jgi:hypothetical protein
MGREKNGRRLNHSYHIHSRFCQYQNRSRVSKVETISVYWLILLAALEYILDKIESALNWNCIFLFVSCAKFREIYLVIYWGERRHIKRLSETDGHVVVLYTMHQLMPTYTSVLKFSATSFMKLIVTRIIKIFSAFYGTLILLRVQNMSPEGSTLSYTNVVYTLHPQNLLFIQICSKELWIQQITNTLNGSDTSTTRSWYGHMVQQGYNNLITISTAWGLPLNSPWKLSPIKPFHSWTSWLWNGVQNWSQKCTGSLFILGVTYTSSPTTHIRWKRE